VAEVETVEVGKVWDFGKAGNSANAAEDEKAEEAGEAGEAEEGEESEEAEEHDVVMVSSLQLDQQVYFQYLRIYTIILYSIYFANLLKYQFYPYNLDLEEK
jgi:hypothetical protein